LYVKKNGVVCPCVGSAQIVLGNIKKQSLREIWNSSLTKIIRDHKLTGKCAKCANYGKTCFSCLGRSSINLTQENLEKNGFIETKGCFNFTPKN